MKKNKSNLLSLNINFGIELLRMILCFWIILFHFGGDNNKKKYKILNTFFHVPTFMIISFYFSYKIFSSKNILKIKLRLERLLIPFLIIPIIKFVIIILLEYPRINKINIKELFIELLLNYITGYNIIVPLWFVHILIIITILFEIIYLLFRNHYLFVLQSLAIISYYLQYSEINFKIFNNYRSHLRAVSHFAEMIPIATTGLNLGYIKILDFLKNYRVKSIFFSIIILLFIYNFNILGEFRGFYYSGIKQNIAALCLFFIFSLIPFEKIINNKYCFIIIRKISSYTGGIYYFHPIIKDILNKIKYLTNQPLLTCIIIYIIGYLICLIGTKIFKKTKFKYLFN